ncbi:ABC transporter permease [Mesorhizobium sp. CAU 1741]|uniref:ABC transporter permease n=1 Tax=Mesorhizobium sp. CAU 1741 TaxID=3140366 RepID=UPI00325AE293
MSRYSPERLFFGALIALICAFILAPVFVVLAASVSPTPFLVFPPTGFTTRWFTDIVTLNQYWQGFKFSFQVAILSTILSVAIALIVGLTMAAAEFRGKALLQAFFLSPIILPELALALGLLQYFSQIGVVRGMMPLVLAHGVVCAPYAIRTIQASAARLDRNLVDCALSLGARPWRALVDITIPMVRPGMVAGAVMAFVMSFDNVTISLFLSSPGSMPLPALLYNQAAEAGLNTTLAAVSAMLIVFMLVVMIVIERLIGLETFAASTMQGKDSRA